MTIRKNILWFVFSIVLLCVTVLGFALTPKLTKDITLYVDGSRIVDGWGQEVKLRGFNLNDRDIKGWGMPLTVDRFRQMKSWGFNVVRNTGFWGKEFEPYQDQPGVYNENYLSRLEQTIINANKAGLYFIISVRVSYDDNDPPDSQGWARHRHLLQEEYLNRFCKLWEMLVQRFDKYPNVVGYCPWHFPWHGTGYTSDEADAYYTNITPALVQTIRKSSNKIIFWTPLHMGSKSMGGIVYQSGQFTEFGLLSDDNIVYIHSGYQPWDVTNDGEEWNYDEDYLTKQNQYAVEFMNTHNVPLMIGEFGLRWHDRPHTESRLDLLEAICRQWETNDYSWLAWWYTTNDPWAVLNQDNTPNEVLDVLEQYTSP